MGITWRVVRVMVLGFRCIRLFPGAWRLTLSALMAFDNSGMLSVLPPTEAASETPRIQSVLLLGPD